MTKIHYLEVISLGTDSTFLFDMDKLELIERRDNIVHIFVHDKHCIIECATNERAQQICVSLFDRWKYWDKK